MRNVIFYVAFVASITPAFGKNSPDLSWKRTAEASPLSLAEMIDVADSPNSDEITLTTQYVVVVDPNARQRKKPGFLSKALLAAVSVAALESPNKNLKEQQAASQARPRKASYLIAAIDRASHKVTYRIHHPRTLSQLQNLIPEFKFSFGEASELTQDTKGWRDSGYCTSGSWIKTGFGTQSYLQGTCTFKQSYSVLVSSALLDKVAVAFEADKYAKLTMGFAAVNRKTGESFMSEEANFYPSEVKALKDKVEEQLKKLSMPTISSSPVGGAAP